MQVAEFDVEQRFVSHIVGKGGAGVQKLREELGVRIDFDEGGASSSTANKDGDATVVKGKKAKTGSSQSHVKIQGRKENVEEAKKRIQRQIEQLVCLLTYHLRIKGVSLLTSNTCYKGR